MVKLPSGRYSSVQDCQESSGRRPACLPPAPHRPAVPCSEGRLASSIYRRRGPRPPPGQPRLSTAPRRRPLLRDAAPETPPPSRMRRGTGVLRASPATFPPASSFSGSVFTNNAEDRVHAPLTLPPPSPARSAAALLLVAFPLCFGDRSAAATGDGAARSSAPPPLPEPTAHLLIAATARTRL